MRTVSFALIATFALAGCAVENVSYPRPQATPYPSTPSAPPGRNIYTTAPHAPLHSEMFACHGGGGSNIGEIGYSGESIRYTPYIQTPAGSLLRMPVETGCLSSGFGWRGTADGGGRQHNGIDLANAEGGWIFAAADGLVISADYRGGYGNTIELDHGRGVHTLYAHLNEIDPNLRPGSRVSSGAAIARMGMTGNATGVHLHYEVWVDRLLVDPLNYGRPPVYVSAPAREPIPLPSTPTYSQPAPPPYVAPSPPPYVAPSPVPYNAPSTSPDDEPIVYPDDEPAPDEPAY